MVEEYDQLGKQITSTKESKKDALNVVYRKEWFFCTCSVASTVMRLFSIAVMACMASLASMIVHSTLAGEARVPPRAPDFLSCNK